MNLYVVLVGSPMWSPLSLWVYWSFVFYGKKYFNFYTQKKGLCVFENL